MCSINFCAVNYGVHLPNRLPAHPRLLTWREGWIAYFQPPYFNNDYLSTKKSWHRWHLLLIYQNGNQLVANSLKFFSSHYWIHRAMPQAPIGIEGEATQGIIKEYPRDVGMICLIFWLALAKQNAKIHQVMALSSWVLRRMPVFETCLNWFLLCSNGERG
jgi:hypothetical protein